MTLDFEREKPELKLLSAKILMGFDVNSILSLAAGGDAARMSLFSKQVKELEAFFDVARRKRTRSELALAARDPRPSYRGNGLSARCCLYGQPYEQKELRISRNP